MTRAFFTPCVVQCFERLGWGRELSDICFVGLGWWFGRPRRARAFCRFGRFHDVEVEDDVTAYLEFEGDVVPGYTIEYNNYPLSCGEGVSVAIAGNATLQILLPGTYVYDAEGGGGLTVPTRQFLPNLPTIQEVTEICAFEAMAIWLVGVTEYQPFRVFELSSPARLVIDIAQ